MSKETSEITELIPRGGAARRPGQETTLDVPSVPEYGLTEGETKLIFKGSLMGVDCSRRRCSQAILTVLRVLEHALNWGNSQNLEGHPNGWPVLGVLPLSNSLSTRTPRRGSDCNTSGGRVSELVLQRLSLGHGPAFL